MQRGFTFQALGAEERTLLRESASGLFGGGGSAADMTALGLTSFCRSPEDAGLAAAILVAEEAGRAASDRAVHLSVMANLAQLGADAGPVFDVGSIAFAQAQYGGERAGGSVLLAGDRLSGALRFAEGLPADRLMVATEEGFAVVEMPASGVIAKPVTTLMSDGLHDLDLADVPCARLRVDPARRDDILLVMRLLLAARARGATERSFALVVDHVKTRHQFGQALGRFQAMQHKLADCHVLLTAAGMLIEAAAKAFDGDAPDWRHHALCALAYGGDALRRAIFEIQHGYGAIGYAEEHEAARHFRRVQGDLVRLGGAARARRALAAALRETGGQLPDMDLGERAEAYRAEIRRLLGDVLTDDIVKEERDKPPALREWNDRFNVAAGGAGLIGISWPKEAGGQARSPLEQLAYIEEFTRADAPMSGMTAASWLVGPEIARHGSESLRADLLPRILRGEASFALGYSEPEAGSDLASLRTRAVREGDHYRITGQKLWGTGTDKATHVLLATRTGGEDKPRHAGISLFIVPLATPGITVTANMALYGRTFCTQFYDDVVVPVENRLGEENGGWEILGGALASERIFMGGQVERLRFFFADLFAGILADPDLGQDAIVLDTLAGFAAEIEAARRLAVHSVRTLERGRLPMVEGAMTKLCTGDLSERLSAFAMATFGTVATLEETADAVPLGGRIEQELRRSPLGVIGGGAAEIQKTLIAQRGLGLPR